MVHAGEFFVYYLVPALAGGMLAFAALWESLEPDSGVPLACRVGASVAFVFSLAAAQTAGSVGADSNCFNGDFWPTLILDLVICLITYLAVGAVLRFFQKYTTPHMPVR